MRTLLLLAISSTILTAAPRLVPAPRQAKWPGGALTLSAPVRIALPGDNGEDRFAAGMLVEELHSIHGLSSEIAARPSKAPAILIGRPGEAPVDAAVRARGLDLSVLDRPESYLLDVNASGVLIASKTAAGVFYGVQTLRQMVAPGAKVPYGSIADWPAMQYRGIMHEISQGPMPTDEQLRRTVRTIAEYKMNQLCLYMTTVFQYRHGPFVEPGAEFTPEQARALVDYARQYHVDIVPHQQMFGHLHQMLKYDLYADMGEIRHGMVLAPGDKRGEEWVRQAGEQLAEVFPSPFLFIGGDETRDLGKGRSREEVARIGVDNVFAKQVTRVAELLKPTGKRLMLWTDMARNHPGVLAKLPQGMVGMSWRYAAQPSYTDLIEPHKKAGMDFIVCPGVVIWRRLVPNFTQATTAINNFVRDGRANGALGMMNTYWFDDGDELFDTGWHGAIFSAAASWEAQPVDRKAFDDAFDWAFYRNDESHAVANAIRALDQFDGIVESTGLDFHDILFWFDPFSAYGADVVRKLYPVAPKIRKLAEQAYIDLYSVKPRLHGETLGSLMFAARRVDAMGLKVELSKEIADRYRLALKNPEERGPALMRFVGAEGIVRDLAEAVTELQRTFRELYLLQNRPYRLDYCLLRYQREGLYWANLQHRFETMRRGKEKLPLPESLGWTLP